MTNKSSTSSSSPLNSAAASALGPAPSDLAITLDVEPRKPRLAWQGMERKELAGAVPTQVVEIVRPGRAVERKEELDLGARAAAARAELVRPDNRLIWTNDNLVALQTLLDERDPKTKDYRCRGKVDLVYIDPPFMVNNDFRADNAIDIELDDKADVQARKEPSLVEIIAYKDTWRQGLDSFVSMLRARLVVLKQLLAPTGSIYVHLDWHASHYVKVLMDEIFGYECFQNEIIWKRTSSHNRTRRWGPVHDAILFYSVSDKFTWNRVLQEYDASYTDNFYRNVDARGKYAVDNLTGPGSRAGPSGLPWRGVNPNPRHWELPPDRSLPDWFIFPAGYAQMSVQDRLDVLEKQGLIYWPQKTGGMPRYKRYLESQGGSPIQDIISDIGPISGQSDERLGYPTQKPLALLQ